jgi:hypothetical protein
LEAVVWAVASAVSIESGVLGAEAGEGSTISKVIGAAASSIWTTRSRAPRIARNRNR